MSKFPAAHRKAVRRDTNSKINVAASASGQVMVLICAARVAVVGMIAVVADFSFMQDQRNMMQTAADSAAMAGAEELNYGDLVAAGQADAASNGYTNGQNGVTVAVNNPPSTGPNSSNTAYVEAIVSMPEPTYFLRVLGVSSIGVSARAVAYKGGGPNCIYVLDPTASSAMSASGSAVIQSNCGLLVDSSASNGMAVNGGATITASAIGVVGGYTADSNVSFTPTPKTGVIAASDPLAYLQAPAVGSCAHTNFSLNGAGSSGSPYQLYPGTYCGGISVNGNSWLNFNAGTYVLAGGGMLIRSGAVMTGAGVTFYNTTGTGGYGPIALSGTSTVNFSAPTSGPLAGVLFFQDRSVPTGAAGSTITGSAGSTFDGALYFPTTQVTYSGNSSVNGYSIVVADMLVVSGNSMVSNNYSSLTDGSPVKGTVLAE
ncbi:pilus assembly protein TadG-related protein [Candidatus Binatus sp.]|uniref:pilus assembly protein TadG-related protein n=1 Tax=Candidatus Binatus sp. TaxID=2811406 RepID=UPI002F95794B